MNIEISKIANLPTEFGKFEVQVFKENEKEHLVITKKPLQKIVNVRIHSECLTGDAISSLKCDCGDQLKASLNYIEKHGGMVLYLRQEGRNIGLLNKINAYNLQDSGLDTIEANHQLGFKADERTYEIVDFILKYYNIKKINLLTNNPDKLKSLHCVEIVDRIPIIIKPNEYNQGYLKVKEEKMGHMLK
ncbi:GTP cyclohydrolase II [Campylobacter blaseri]|uniref:GTP cyclohydrolase-2 n=1 Tax=Campylobacter blaseri TaxID=2042961 RepID=A0A2P8R0M0_9BACT|nr:GTP cyclohydrolase II [Campylobacter blaseri]PSM52039.1 GTP cyclohydrolase II [Campylobacter blaseri]PSM53824.1 GTP cyclohydrolase II [Campylobacter blaseri]QKF85624.1 GTP cyclohydrolase II [Campylobacter blaseri]